MIEGDTLISLPADRDDDGELVYEELEAEPLDSGLYRLRHSPGLVHGVAAGDVIRITSPDTFDVVDRSGNLSVWVYGSDGHQQTTIDELTPQLQRLGGRLDGGSGKLVIFTIPVDAGFAAAEEVLNAHVARHPKTEWYYGNVYAEGGDTPLGWWDDR
jgi:hypothetical protein